MRQIRYQQIAEDLRTRVSAGEFDAAKLLPSEASLGAGYEASRVTIRKSLELLRNEGLVESRQGFGWMVTTAPIQQALAGLATIEAQLAASGRSPERQILDFKFVDATKLPTQDVAERLGERVLEVRRVNLADGEPFGRVTVWCREDLGAQLSKAQVEEHSFYEVLPVSLGGATQTIGAAVVTDEDAELLNVPSGSAVLVVARTTSASTGEPVLVSEHVFPSHLTQFVVDLPATDVDAAGPAGLRLVSEA